VPLANVYGVRLSFLVSSFGAATLSIWAALAPNFGQFVAARVLSSTFYAAPEAFGPQIVADVFFLHQRATCTSIFSICQFLGFTFAGLIGGFATLNHGFRAPSWVMVGLTYGAFLALAVMMPETSYTRDGQFDEDEKRTVVDHFRLWPASGGGAPKVSSIWHSFRYPWLYLPHPIVIMTTAYFSMVLATNDYLLTTNSLSMQEVYGFGLAGVSLTSFAPTLGVILGAIYGGYANDKVFLPQHGIV
jgi:MFS family permease